MNTLKFNYSNPINDVFQANNQTIISNRYHYRSPYRSRFQYPPLISNLTNPNISPQLKSLINSSPTLKALSQSFLPSIPNNTEPIEETEKKSVLEPISEKKQSVTKKKTPKKEKLPKLQPIKEQKTNQQQNITPRKRNNIRFSNETTNVNQLNVNKSKTTISLPSHPMPLDILLADSHSCFNNADSDAQLLRDMVATSCEQPTRYAAWLMVVRSLAVRLDFDMRILPSSILAPMICTFTQTLITTA